MISNLIKKKKNCTCLKYIWLLVNVNVCCGGGAGWRGEIDRREEELTGLGNSGVFARWREGGGARWRRVKGDKW